MAKRQGKNGKYEGESRLLYEIMQRCVKISTMTWEISPESVFQNIKFFKLNQLFIL